jgi:hypothetical protein
MPPEISALVEKPHLLLAILLVGTFIGVLAQKFQSKLRRKSWREKNRWRWDRKPQARNVDLSRWLPSPRIVPAQPDAADQLRIVMGATFTVQAVLNSGEARVMKTLENSVLICNPEWRVLAQVSLGEILRSTSQDAYSCINSKRVDLLLMDENCRPRHVIEYQGLAHHQGTAAARDAVKKEALRRAGIGYHEVVAGHTTPSELRRLVEKLVEGSPERSTHRDPPIHPCDKLATEPEMKRGVPS